VSWSPGDSLIAYDVDHDISVIQSSGGAARKLTDDAFSDSWPAWSPDGASILFGSDRGGMLTDLWSVPSGGGIPSRITYSWAATEPAWSPDGRFIAFTSLSTGLGRIWVVDLESQVYTQITDGLGEDRMPTWSPSGDRIAFCSDRNGPSGAWNIWLISFATAGVSQSGATWGAIKALFR
jgi:TolB protein